MSCFCRSRVVFGLAILVGSCLPGWSQVIYDQPSVFPTGTQIPMLVLSQNDLAQYGNFATAYDDFALRNTALITDVHWQGTYINPSEQGTITAFTVTFWDDNSGKPGTALLSNRIDGAPGETFLGRDILQDPVFQYNADLPTPFAASGGTRYWISIVPDLQLDKLSQHLWGWYYGTGGDGAALSDYAGSLNNPVPSDLAFSLTSHTAAASTPEPSSLALIAGAGVAGFAILRRRSR